MRRPLVLLLTAALTVTAVGGIVVVGARTSLGRIPEEAAPAHSVFEDVDLPAIVPSVSAETPTASPSLHPVRQVAAGSPHPVVEGFRIPILLYHRIGPAQQPNPSLFIDIPHLTAQLEAIASSRVATLTLDQVHDAVLHRTTFPKGVVAITFDDASEDQFTGAFPILRRLGLRATYYTPTARIGGPGWLTWAQIRQMQATGLIQFAAHTVTHADLPTLSVDAARAEIQGSKLTLERMLGVPVHAFAYPFGHFNATIERLAKEAGFDSAVTVRFALVHTVADAFTWGRLEIRQSVKPSTLVEIARRSGSIGPEPGIRSHRGRRHRF